MSYNGRKMILRRCLVGCGQGKPQKKRKKAVKQFVIRLIHMSVSISLYTQMFYKVADIYTYKHITEFKLKLYKEQFLETISKLTNILQY